MDSRIFWRSGGLVFYISRESSEYKTQLPREDTIFLNVRPRRSPLRPLLFTRLGPPAVLVPVATCKASQHVDL